MTVTQIGAIAFLAVGLLIVVGILIRDGVRDGDLGYLSGCLVPLVFIGSWIPAYFAGGLILDHWGKGPLILLFWPLYFATFALFFIVFFTIMFLVNSVLSGISHVTGMISPDKEQSNR